MWAWPTVDRRRRGLLWIALEQAGAASPLTLDGTLDGIVEISEIESHVGGFRRRRRGGPIHYQPWYDLDTEGRGTQPHAGAPSVAAPALLAGRRPDTHERNSREQASEACEDI